MRSLSLSLSLSLVLAKAGGPAGCGPRGKREGGCWRAGRQASTVACAVHAAGYALLSQGYELKQVDLMGVGPGRKKHEGRGLSLSHLLSSSSLALSLPLLSVLCVCHGPAASWNEFLGHMVQANVPSKFTLPAGHVMHSTSVVLLPVPAFRAHLRQALHGAADFTDE